MLALQGQEFEAIIQADYSKYFEKHHQSAWLAAYQQLANLERTSKTGFIDQYAESANYQVGLLLPAIACHFFPKAIVLNKSVCCGSLDVPVAS